MLNAVKSLILNANPYKILVDFEKAAMNSFQQVYPLATITGCYFHLCQSVLRKVNEIGMKREYENNPDMRSFIRCFPALAFVPTDDVSAAYDRLVETAVHHSLTPNLHQQVGTFLNFFENTYIRGKRLRGPGRGRIYAEALFLFLI